MFVVADGPHPCVEDRHATYIVGMPHAVTKGNSTSEIISNNGNVLKLQLLDKLREPFGVCFDAIVGIGGLTRQSEAEVIDGNAPKVVSKFFHQVAKSERPFGSAVNKQDHAAISFVDVMLGVSVDVDPLRFEGGELFVDPGRLYEHAT